MPLKTTLYLIIKASVRFKSLTEVYLSEIQRGADVIRLIRVTPCNIKQIGKHIMIYNQIKIHWKSDRVLLLFDEYFRFEMNKHYSFLEFCICLK